MIKRQNLQVWLIHYYIQLTIVSEKEEKRSIKKQSGSSFFFKRQYNFFESIKFFQKQNIQLSSEAFSSPETAQVLCALLADFGYLR